MSLQGSAYNKGTDSLSTSTPSSNRGLKFVNNQISLGGKIERSPDFEYRDYSLGVDKISRLGIDPEGLFLTPNPKKPLNQVEKLDNPDEEDNLGFMRDYNSGIYTNNSRIIGSVLDRNSKQMNGTTFLETQNDASGKHVFDTNRLTLHDHSIEDEGEKFTIQESLISKPIFRKDKLQSNAFTTDDIFKTAADLLNQLQKGPEKSAGSLISTPKKDTTNNFKEVMTAADKILEISKMYVPESTYPTPRKLNSQYKESSHFIHEESSVPNDLESIRPLNFKMNDFEIGKKLGKGRFGNVYLAREKKSKFIVALKILVEKELIKAGAESTFLNEIKIQTFLKHPNILQLYGFFYEDQQIVLILEYSIDGELFKVLNKQPEYKFEEKEAAGYIKQVSLALAYMHKHAAIHRDIKPENILISHGVLKLSDFGWANTISNRKRTTFCGTLDYVPPEIVKGKQYDEKADMWSLGVLCYELCSGKVPFEGQEQSDTFKKIITNELVLPEFFSNELKDLVSKLIIKNPAERLSIEQVLDHPWVKSADEVPNQGKSKNHGANVNWRMEILLK